MAQRSALASSFTGVRAVGYYKDLLGLNGAVQPTILDGITSAVPAFGGDKDRWILWTSTPDTNRLGHPIGPLQFDLESVRPKTTPTNDPRNDMLHRLLGSCSRGASSWPGDVDEASLATPRALAPSAVLRNRSRT